MEAEKTPKRRQKLKKHVRSAAITATAAASLALGSLFDSPDALLNTDDASDPETAIVSVGKVLSVGQSAAALSVPERVRAWLLRMPTVVRAVVLLPLWLAGNVGIAALTAGWRALTPFLPAMLRILLNTILLFGIVLLAYKLLFPKRRVRELFRKRNLVPLLVAVGIVAVGDALLPVLVKNGAAIRLILRAVIGLIALLIVCGRILANRRRKTHASEVTL